MRTDWIRTSKNKTTVGNNIHSPKPKQLFKETHRDQWIAGIPSHVGIDIPKEVPSLIAVGGGKGGVGKSIVSANISAKLGGAGFKVLLIDLDIGSANLHTYFGLSLPKKNLADVILNNDKDFASILLKTPADGVILAPGGKDESWADLSHFGAGAFNTLWDNILYAKERLAFDFVILDLGAGTHRHTIDFFTAAHQGIITVLPEPTSIENAYSFLKATQWRLIENAGMHCNQIGAADQIKEILVNDSQTRGLKSSHIAKLKQLEEKYPQLIHHLFMSLKGRQIGFIVNQIRSQRDIDIGHSMGTIANNYFGFQTHSVGYLNYDDAAWKSLRNRRLLVLDFPHSILSRRLTEVTGKILAQLGY